MGTIGSANKCIYRENMQKNENTQMVVVPRMADAHQTYVLQSQAIQISNVYKNYLQKILHRPSDLLNHELNFVQKSGIIELCWRNLNMVFEINSVLCVFIFGKYSWDNFTFRIQ